MLKIWTTKAAHICLGEKKNRRDIMVLWNVVNFYHISSCQIYDNVGMLKKPHKAQTQVQGLCVP